MSSSPRGVLVRRTIDLNYENKKRGASYKWMALNGVVLLLFAYDLCRVCPGHTSVMHHVELALAVVALANLVQHAYSALPRRRPRLSLSPRQQRLLGLRDADLDRSLELSRSEESSPAPPTPEVWPAEELALSMCAQRRDTSPGGASPTLPRTPPSPHSPHGLHTPRSYSPTSPYSPSSPYTPTSPYTHSPYTQHSPYTTHSPHSPHSPHTMHTPDRFPRDEFISDRRALADYLRQEEVRGAAMDVSWGITPLAAPLASPVYQIATVNTEGGTEENARGPRSPPACRRLNLDPQRLTEFDLNLRLWIHATILERVVRELGRLDSLLAAAGAEARAGGVPLERLHAAAAAAGPSGATCYTNLLPFLEPFADQRYAVQRIRELARGGCLSGYKWDGGSGDWEDSRPTDAELVLQLFASYLDTQLPGGGAGCGPGAGVRRPFSEAHITSSPQPAPRGPRALAIHRVTRRPPHYVLALGDETIEVCRGRNNMLRSVLVFIAAAARADPPALQRVHLGRAGLNLLWVIGR